jgi:hypothetical protein
MPMVYFGEPNSKVLAGDINAELVLKKTKG